MNRIVKKVIAICLLIACVMVPITVPGETDYPTGCAYCGTMNGRVHYDTRKYAAHDNTKHWDIDFLYLYCVNKQCERYGKGMQFHKALKVVGSDESHKYNINRGSTYVSVTNLNASQHKLKYKDTKECICGQPSYTYRYVTENHRFTKISEVTKANGDRVINYRCMCGRTKTETIKKKK